MLAVATPFALLRQVLVASSERCSYKELILSANACPCASSAGLDPFARQQGNGEAGRRGPNKCCSDELQPGGAEIILGKEGSKRLAHFCPTGLASLGVGQFNLS
jgi:hypothetical protein